MTNRITESEMGQAVLQILAVKSDGEATIAYLKGEMPKYLDLSKEDRAQSQTRSNEEMWEQQVRNLISHRAAEGNIICEGYAQYDEEQHLLRLTETGRKIVSR